MKGILDTYCRALSFIMAASLAIMVVLVFGNVLLRYGFNSGITISEELSRWLFVWMTFLGAVVAIADRAHLGTDTLVSRLSLRGKRIAYGLTILLCLFVCVLLLQGAWKQMVINWSATSAVMEISQGWLYLSGVVFAVSALGVFLWQGIRLLRSQTTEAELVGFAENEDEANAAAHAGDVRK